IGGPTGGEGGIRTLGRGLKPYNGLANRPVQPLRHLTVGASFDSWPAKRGIVSQASTQLAEGAGFEPAAPSRARSLSRRLPSTTRPPLRAALPAARSAPVLPCRRQGHGGA